MTDKDIIKALECCIKPTSDCDNCPLYVKGDGDCINIVKQGALDLINRQQAEIERLKAEARAVDKDLQKLDRPLIEIRAEAIKEFAEKLKEKAYKPNPYPYIEIVTKDDIDNLVKEMVGEGK